MSIDLSDYVSSLRREISPPGSTVFDSVPDSSFIGYLADAFWQASLDGFFVGYSADDSGLVTETTATTEFSRAQVALVILYAAITVLRNRIMNTSTSFRAKAGPVEFEQQNSATMLTELLRELAATKTALVASIEAGATLVAYFDAYSTRSYSALSYSGGLELTDI